MAVPHYTIWGSELSPFSIQVRAMCQYMGFSFDWLPDGGGTIQGFRAYGRVVGLTGDRLPLTYPEKTELSWYPSVPFMFADDGSNFYDSTAFAHWLDDQHSTASRRLIPEDPLCAFVTRIIDEYFDEFGLYVAHHMRWVASARQNNAGERLAKEFFGFLPAWARRPFGQWFSRRQVRRLPYLFSVAREGWSLQGMSPGLTPPARKGFPPTHALLEGVFFRELQRIEAVLEERPFLFGSVFTLADASVYGELGINAHDPEACEMMGERAPLTLAWLRRIDAGELGALEDGAPPAPADVALLRPMLEDVVDIFIPLMEQNEAAYERCIAAGQTRFNEPAFDAGEALYDGELMGVPFRSVVKTFQVEVWRRLKGEYAALDANARAGLPERLRVALDLSDSDGDSASLHASA